MLTQEDVDFLNRLTGTLERWCRKRDIAIKRNANEIKQLRWRVNLFNKHEALMYVAFGMLGVGVISLIIGMFFR